MGILVAVALVLSSAQGAAARDPAASTEVVRLEELIAHRLGLMRDVAVWKWRHGAPIDDPAQETRVLDGATGRAEALGLDPDSTRRFVAVQVAAAKTVQRFWFATWTRDGFPASAPDPDLTAVLRPAIERTGDAVLEQLTLARPALDDPEQQAMLATYLFMRTEGLGVTREIAGALADAASHVAYGPRGSALDRIRARGKLRVGTTGDYPPFSERAAAGAGYTGIDVDLANALAESLGVQAVFVATSWRTLMADHAAGRFDIAMSGITRTLDRQRTAYFSDPYRTDGKAPLVRCGEEARFDTLTELDDASVRLIVNPGGTNESFARARLPHATLRVFADNTRIADEIAAGRADVMVTDRSEVDVQAARRPGVLCAAIDGTFTVTQKAFLLPRDEPWLRYVNAWLAELRAEGMLASVFARHGARPAAGAP